MKVWGCISWQQATSFTQVWSDSLRCMLTHGSSLPQRSEMFIWTHAINPKLSRRQGWAWFWWRRPAPMIICGLVLVRQPTKRPQTATGWRHLWPRPLQISQGPLFCRGKYFYNIKLFSWIYLQTFWETVLILKKRLYSLREREKKFSESRKVVNEKKSETNLIL